MVLEWGGFINPLLNGLIVNDVPVKNRLHLVCGDVCVPNAFRPNHQNWPAFAHPQTVNFAAENDSFWALLILEPHLPHEALQRIPGFESCGWIAALRFGGCGAEQQVMADQAATAAIDIRWVPRATCSRTARRAH